MRWLVVTLAVAAALGGGCSRGTSTAPRRDGHTTAAPASADAATDGSARGADALDGGAAEAAAETPRGGLHGRVVPVAEAPPATVLAFRPGSTDAVWTGQADGRGRFHAPELPPGTYRVVLPGDGVHSTADLYASVGPPDAGPTVGVTVHRSKGCPVTATFRLGEADADAPPIAGAEVEMRMPDLEHVPERLVLRGTTDESGQVTVVGTCVRGFIEGTLRVPGRAPQEFRHGYLGSGRDRFEIAFPPGGAADGGPGAR